MDPARQFSAFFANRSGKRSVAMVVLLAGIAFGSLWHLRLIDRVYLPFNRSDLLQCWAATRVALSGGDPWSAAAVERIEQPYYAGLPQTIIHPRPQPFFYPGHLLPLLIPLAWISWPTVRLLFLIMSPVVLLASTWLGLRALGLPLSRTAAALASLMVCYAWPAMWSFRLQQITIMIAVTVLAALFCLVREEQIAAGALVALATTKPPLAIPLVLWLLLRAATRREWRFSVGFGSSMALLLYAAQRIVPGWIPRWVTLLHTYPASPQMQLAFGRPLGIVFELLMTLAAGVALWRLRGFPAASPQFRTGFALCLSVAVLVSPWQPAMIYNYLLLIPAALFIVFRIPEQPLAARLRPLVVAQVTLDVGAAFISAVGEMLTGGGNFWVVLPFFDVTLPFLASLVLILEGWHLSTAESATKPAVLGATAG